LKLPHLEQQWISMSLLFLASVQYCRVATGFYYFFRMKIFTFSQSTNLRKRTEKSIWRKYEKGISLFITCLIMAFVILLLA